jgi:hypothetical protein
MITIGDLLSDILIVEQNYVKVYAIQMHTDRRIDKHINEYTSNIQCLP